MIRCGELRNPVACCLVMSSAVHGGMVDKASGTRLVVSASRSPLANRTPCSPFQGQEIAITDRSAHNLPLRKASCRPLPTTNSPYPLLDSPLRLQAVIFLFFAIPVAPAHLLSSHDGMLLFPQSGVWDPAMGFVSRTEMRDVLGIRLIVVDPGRFPYRRASLRIQGSLLSIRKFSIL